MSQRLIDVPIAESMPNSTHWTLLLHRLGWKRPKGSPLEAHRAIWEGNTEIAFDLIETDWSAYPKPIAMQLASISKTSFYSVLGTRESPVDVNLASVVAIELLTAEMTSSQPVPYSRKPDTDYSAEPWNQLVCLPVKSLSKSHLRPNQLPRVGILVATDVERQSVLNRLKPPPNRRSVLQIYEGRNSYFLGRLGVTTVVLAMSAMGSVGRDSATIVTSELIDQWGLDAVVMTGIAFGKDSEKQMIGGVLISEHVVCYEPQRLGTPENQDRGETYHSTPVLLNRFRNVVGWDFKNPIGMQCSHQIGLLLSGEKLVDNANEKAKLFLRFPKAIGGEMEGAGFAAAAERRRCEWIVIKAICDWGDGTKQKHHQAFAAAASVDLLTHVLNQAGALDSLGNRA